MVARTVGDYRAGRIADLLREQARRLLTIDELISAQSEIVARDGRVPADDEDVGQNDFLYTLTVLGESLSMWLFEPRSEREVEWRFYNDLQDFISESSFGWGQLRGSNWSDPED